MEPRLTATFYYIRSADFLQLCLKVVIRTLLNDRFSRFWATVTSNGSPYATDRCPVCPVGLYAG